MVRLAHERGELGVEQPTRLVDVQLRGLDSKKRFMTSLACAPKSLVYVLVRTCLASVAA